MSAIRKKAQRVIEKLTGVDFEHTEGKSFFVIDAAKRGAAWYSYRSMLRSVLESQQIDHVLDVGANTGQFGRTLRSVYAGRISSFEPVSRPFQELEANIGSDGDWHAYNFALGSSESTQVIHVSPSSVFSSLLPTNDYCASRFGARSVANREELIRIRRLDAVLDEIAAAGSLQKIFLKLDTQGFDMEVFKGLGNRLDDVRVLQSEISLIPIYDNMPHWTESISLYEEAGFGVVGMFPVTWDAGRVVEYDCLLTRRERDQPH
jgi:FkbM family methyltransferase